MSKIGKQPIIIPNGVEVKIDNDIIFVKGPKGELRKKIPQEIRISIEGDRLLVVPAQETKKVKALWGLTRSLILNLIKGVVDGYEKKLEIEGIGYKALLKDNKLILSLGFSHPVEFSAPEGINFKVEKNIIVVSGIDKELVGQVAASIRALKKPEPYKGKGIRYEGEIIRTKAGKKAVSTG